MARIMIAMLLAAGPVCASDPTGVDIIGLRLGMQESQVAAALTHQGYRLTTSTMANTSQTLIVAKTLDGLLDITLSGARGVTEIRYTFKGFGSDEPMKIRESILNRFGTPNQAEPQTWCRTASPDGICPPDDASLTFLPGSLTLILLSGAETTRTPSPTQR